MEYRCHKIILREKHFYTNRERCEVLTGCLSLGWRSGGDCANMRHWTKRLTTFFSTGSSICSSYFHILFLIAFLEEAFMRNIIIILCGNYTIIISINYNYGKLHTIILLFKIPMGTWKIFFEIYGQFGHAPSLMFTVPELASGMDFRGLVWLPAVMTDLSVVQSILTQPVSIQPPV